MIDDPSFIELVTPVSHTANRLISNLIPHHRTIKHGHLFLVDDPTGTIPFKNDSGLGLYASDTRFLSCFEIYLNGVRAIPLLSSTEAGDRSVVVYTNPEMTSRFPDGGTLNIPPETIQLTRHSLLNGALFEQFNLTNYNHQALRFEILFTVAADFRDIFEVRDFESSNAGTYETPEFAPERLTFRYKDGLGETYETRILFKDFEPKWLGEDKHGKAIFAYEATLGPMERKTFNLEVHAISPCKAPDVCLIPAGFEDAERKSQADRLVWENSITQFYSDNEDFNEMLARSANDIRMLMTHPGCQENGSLDEYVAAGIPWFVALFGRDSLITARDCLVLNPEIAKSVLKILAKYQGQESNDWRDEEPGKILHELRLGELARTAQIPHTPYYGTVDATPLWLILLDDYYLWTQDRDTLETLWPNALKALSWIDRNLEENPLGYLTYFKKSSKGLDNQGWKDSWDSAMYADGAIAVPPIALAEVQGYVYIAKRKMAQLAEFLGDRDLSRRLRKECQAFRKRFNSDFWLDELDYCALGLDYEGKRLEVISSNPGHCLETGMFTPAHARKVADRLLEPDMFSGWGIRTLSSKSVAYNPMSYHNGSIWPHDNAMIARGLVAVHRSDLAEKVFTGIYEAGRLMQYKRIPELFCGFERVLSHAEPPVRYPTACSPQAWSASAVFAFTHALLNFNPRINQSTLVIKQPRLPAWIKSLQVKNLRVGPSALDLEFHRTERGTIVDILEQRGKTATILLEKY